MPLQAFTAPKPLPYLLYLPPDDGKKHPFLLYLHGAGERGNDPQVLRGHGLIKHLERDDFPFAVLAPQCPTDSWWSLHLPEINLLFQATLAQYPIDLSRVYLTGISMGGHGAWCLGALRPDYFAAAAIICAPNLMQPDQVCTMKNVPTWVFHGDADETVPLVCSEIMVDALQACGGDVRFTVYPGVGHDSWNTAYADPTLYEWFLTHQRA